MKLTLTLTGPGAHAAGDCRELRIQNAAATVDNLRAAISVSLKVPASSFTLRTPTGVVLADGTVRLSAVPLVDGNTIEVDVADSPAPKDAAPPAAKVARTEGSDATAAASRAAPSRPRSTMDLQLGAAVARMIRSHQGEHGTGADSSSGSGSTSSSLGSLMEDIAFEGDFDDDDSAEIESGGTDDDMEDDAVHGGADALAELLHDDDDDDDDEEISEQAELAAELLALPAMETLKQRFDADPRATMEAIQQSNPNLFTRIAQNPQFFLDFLAASVSSGFASSSSSSARVPDTASSLTEEDTRRIENLMQLGYSRQQCTEAYLQNGKNPDRAAVYLFDRFPPS